MRLCVSVIGYRVFNLRRVVGYGYGNSGMVGCFACTTLGGCAGVSYTLRSDSKGIVVDCGIFALIMAAIWRSSTDCLSPRCGISIDGGGTLEGIFSICYFMHH